MTRTLDAQTLVQALVLPGSDAETAYRDALEGRAETTTTPAALVELARLLVGRLGWDPALAEDAVAQVLRLSRVAEPAPDASAYPPSPAS